MKKTIHRPEYRELIDALREARIAACLSQDVLAKTLRWTQQKLSSTESCGRRLDIIEFLELAHALGLSPRAAFELLRAVGPTTPSAR